MITGVIEGYSKAGGGKKNPQAENLPRQPEGFLFSSLNNHPTLSEHHGY